MARKNQENPAVDEDPELPSSPPEDEPPAGTSDNKVNNTLPPDAPSPGMGNLDKREMDSTDELTQAEEGDSEKSPETVREEQAQEETSSGAEEENLDATPEEAATLERIRNSVGPDSVRALRDFCRGEPSDTAVKLPAAQDEQQEEKMKYAVLEVVELTLQEAQEFMSSKPESGASLPGRAKRMLYLEEL
jgi:hypothetical protein